MIQLSPRENFTIVRQLTDHTDSATYYVQAVVRNAKTDALIATVNLDDKGSRRFSKAYIVPADVAGTGLWITILTSVYTDAGYTTQSGNYGDELETYLVQERYNPILGGGLLGGIGGGPDIDYKRIRKMIEEVVKQYQPKFPKVIEVEKQVIVKEPMELPKMPDIGPMAIMCKKTMAMVNDIGGLIERNHGENMKSRKEHSEALSGSVKMTENSGMDNSSKVLRAIDALDKKLDTWEVEIPNIQLKLNKPKGVVESASPMSDRVTKLMKLK